MNYNTVGHEDGDGEEEKERKHYHLLRSRFGMNFMGVLSGQLYVTKVRFQYMTKRGDDV